MYLCVHALSWIDITPDDPRRQTALWEQWPGRCELCHSYEFKLQRRYGRLIRDAKDDEGIFFLPTGMQANTALIESARKHFGARCVVCSVEGSPEDVRRTFGSDFVKGLEADKRQAIGHRGRGLTKQELNVWTHSKAWAMDLDRQLEQQGYTYDRAAVEFMAFGEDWSGCAATYPIYMGRAFGLAMPIERRFDLINPDESPMLLRASLVEQNLPMAGHVRLFIFKTANVPPTWGRYVAQYWEGIHGIEDRPHVVKVGFPPDSVKEVNLDGVGIGRARMAWETLYGRIAMNVGCGAHTRYCSTVVMTEQGLSLKDFRAALLAGEVSETR